MTDAGDYIKMDDNAKKALNELLDAWEIKTRTPAIVCFVDMCGSSSYAAGAKRTVYGGKVAMLYAILHDFLDDPERQLHPPFLIAKTTGDGAMLVRCFDSDKYLDASGRMYPNRQNEFATSVLETCNHLLILLRMLKARGVYSRIALTTDTKLVTGADLKHISFGTKQAAVANAISDNDLWGHEVNKAARIESFAGPNQLLIDENIATYLAELFDSWDKPEGCLMDRFGCWQDCPLLKTCQHPAPVRILRPPFERGCSFRARGIGPVSVYQAVGGHDAAPEEVSHIIGNYRFGALVLLQSMPHSTIPKKTYLDAVASAFPPPQGDIVYQVHGQGLHVENGQCRPWTEIGRHYHMAAVFLCTDFVDFADRMAQLSTSLSGDNNPQRLFSYSSSHPLLKLAESGPAAENNTGFHFDPISLFAWSSTQPQHRRDFPKPRLGSHCIFAVVKLDNQQTATEAVNILSTLARGRPPFGFDLVLSDWWVSVGFYDLVIVLDASAPAPRTDADSELKRVHATLRSVVWKNHNDETLLFYAERGGNT